MRMRTSGQPYRGTYVQGFLDGLARLPLLWLRRLHFRHELANLDAEQIKDAGFDPDRIRAEAAKPFWRK